MESDNLNRGDSPLPPPNQSDTPENVNVVKRKRRKRGKGKPLSHYKVGTVRGRPRSGECVNDQPSSSIDANKDDESLCTPGPSEDLFDELANIHLNLPPAPPIASSSPYATPQKLGDVPASLIGPATQRRNVPTITSEFQDTTGSTENIDNRCLSIENVNESGPSTEKANEPASPSVDVSTPPSSGVQRAGEDDAGHLLEIETNSDLQELIKNTSSELQRRIHMPFLVLPEDDGINVLLLSRCKERSVQRRVFFSSDGREEITVHTKTLPAEILKDILMVDVNCPKVPLTTANEKLFVQRVVTVVNRLRSYEVCVGVDDSQCKPLWEIELKNGEIDKNPYKEARYSETFRPSGCQLLVTTKRYTKRHCSFCIRTKMRFKANLPQHVASDFKPATPNVHLDRSQLIAKVQQQQTELQYARLQIARLKVKLSEAIESDGVDIQESLHNDFCSILETAELTSLQALFFEQQLKAATAKDARTRRWHPTLIRFAILLKSTSTAAYRAVQDSGLIVLPSERTLYEYSHAVSPEAGCTTAKLDRVCKRIVQLYPETYQKYHVLLMDEMHINKKLVFLKSSGEMIGYVNVNSADQELQLLEAELKGEKNPDTPPLATKIEAYMIKGVATAVSEVVGTYPTTDAFDCGQMYDMTWEVIGALEKSGLRVVAIVSDGAAVNRAFYNMHVPLTKTSSVTFDTVNLCAPSRPLYFFADGPHLLKTIRNCFHKSGTGPSCSRLLTTNGQVIVWQTIRRLYEEDKDKTLRRCFKLNAENVYLNSFTVMKVNYAAQVLSKSVALDLESRNWPGTSETVKFIKYVNDFFDMINGASSNQGTRQANTNLNPYINANDERFDKLQHFLQYLNKWKDEVDTKERFSNSEKGKMMLSQQTLDGIHITVLAFIGATKFLLSEGVKYINARVFCQDPLERYFSKQRQSGGGSRNPTAAQVFSNEVKIGVHRDMNVRKSNVAGNVRSMEVSNEPLAKRKRPSIKNVCLLILNPFVTEGGGGVCVIILFYCLLFRNDYCCKSTYCSIFSVYLFEHVLLLSEIYLSANRRDLTKN